MRTNYFLMSTTYFLLGRKSSCVHYFMWCSLLILWSSSLYYGLLNTYYPALTTYHVVFTTYHAVLTTWCLCDLYFDCVFFYLNLPKLHTYIDTCYQLVLKIASLGRQEPQPLGTTKWATTLSFGKILGTTSVVRSIQNPPNVVRYKIHRP